ncbi:hypothetical protein [Shewanella chilikensis]|uniref:hypothetical protein n=1 Tax=Shewanella chilikensis TaxID=558541 RepID=UPI001F34DBC4|nr:hypothetical protein [Shewanella chilikensis]MCE9788373.1 hypothetical protein [Shewanella chilikensis]
MEQTVEKVAVEAPKQAGENPQSAIGEDSPTDKKRAKKKPVGRTGKSSNILPERLRKNA